MDAAAEIDCAQGWLDPEGQLVRAAVCFESEPSLDRPRLSIAAGQIGFTRKDPAMTEPQFSRVIGVDVASEKIDVNDSHGKIAKTMPL